MRDEEYMRLALEIAREAARAGEIPVGAVVVQNGQVIAQAGNEKLILEDATAHAELLALQRAARHLGTWRLQEATLYCTLEPCPMCAGAMINARLGRLVFGAWDEKGGAAGSVLDIVRCPGLNHQVQVQAGILKEECAEPLTAFFADLRRDGRGAEGARLEIE
ncbi:MAG TPA: tRNA adenosine(34) deaminase TadA [Syntrophomonadaceae bacterium]|nr:tRNA adenosine(34) deaminase TadA [Syntrophomonadaceae bacterium]